MPIYIYIYIWEVEWNEFRAKATLPKQPSYRPTAATFFLIFWAFVTFEVEYFGNGCKL
jgi:hypothetical protein